MGCPEKNISCPWLMQSCLLVAPLFSSAPPREHERREVAARGVGSEKCRGEGASSQGDGDGAATSDQLHTGEGDKQGGKLPSACDEDVLEVLRGETDGWKSEIRECGWGR